MAAVTLVVWLAAVAFCALAESASARAGSSGKMTCAGAVPCATHCDGATPSPASKPSSPAKPVCPPESSACQVLKSAVLGATAAKVVPLALPALYTSPVLALTLAAQIDPPATSIFRDARPRDWVFTPEVSLGPAHRSHAPPSFA